ncbi:hypothetical protein OAT67_07890, partial [Bacteriovoracaceae bacterium]|nr:hypothetical protein [Bacteriovoracaceae bacterium]
LLGFSLSTYADSKIFLNCSVTYQHKDLGTRTRNLNVSLSDKGKFYYTIYKGGYSTIGRVDTVHFPDGLLEISAKSEEHREFRDHTDYELLIKQTPDGGYKVGFTESSWSVSVNGYYRVYWHISDNAHCSSN